MHIAEGYITVVQEQRFRLVTDDGRGLLLTLAENARVDGHTLQGLHNNRTHVRVEYEGEPNMASGVAHAIKYNARQRA
jgi:hypothetical protein